MNIPPNSGNGPEIEEEEKKELVTPLEAVLLAGLAMVTDVAKLELWEKAFSTRRKQLQDNNSDIRDHDSASRDVDDSSCSRTKEEADQLGSSKKSPESEQMETDEIVPFLSLGDPHLTGAKLQGDAFESNIAQQREDKGEQVHGENGETFSYVEFCMTSEREKIKETDEYKRAMEEEWVCRREEIQIQAKEAQHMRRLQKRKRAESMRLLDMEKKQKQRIDEIRDIKRKDEENMNLKESIRLEVRTELNTVETQCHSMSSLLNLLGISVGGWPNPQPQEVQTAYKRALLAFHPDRASRSDIRQQVEAEEKFKLINRLKMKFSP